MQLRETGDAVEAVTADGSCYRGVRAVVCLPPQLAASTIEFAPSLPAGTAQLLPRVHTWMAGSVKFAVEYPTAFWRTRGYSGMVYSHFGIVTEMYDHTNYDADRFGFTGFLGGGAAGFVPEVRRELVLQQLVTLFGPEAGTPSAYLDRVWTGEHLVAGSPVIHRPHQHNGDPRLHQAYLGGKLYFCGTETAAAHGGYLEGAVTAAERVAALLG